MTNGTGKYLTTCRFCGKKIAEAPALNIPETGDPGKGAVALLQLLGRHIAIKHPEQFERGKVFLDEVLSFVILNAFHHEDPSVPARIERIRAELFAQVRKNTITDPMLQHAVAGIGLDPEEAAAVLKWFQSIRDACCEFGAHAAPGNISPAHPSPLIISA